MNLADKLINTISKEKNQTITDHIEIKRDKLFEREYDKFVIQPLHKRTDLFDTVKAVSEFNTTIQPYLI